MTIGSEGRDDSGPRRRFLIAHNPTSGPRRRHGLVGEVAACLRARGASVEIVSTAGAEADRELARTAAASGRYDAIIAAGGDGTLRALAAGLVGSPVALGLVPLGTGNVMATELGLHRHAARLADGLLTAPARGVKPGLANGAPFMLMASAGVDARILARLDLGVKRRIGQLAYVPPTLAELGRRLDSFPVTLDGRETQCTWVIVSRVRFYGGRFVVAPDQRLGDDGFHAVLVRTTSRLGLARVLLAAAAGRLASCPLVEIRPCRTARIGGDVPVQVDGEEAGRAPLDIALGTQDVRLIVP